MTKAYMPHEPARDWTRVDWELGNPNDQGLVKLAQQFSAGKRNYASTRVLTSDYRLVGLAGDRHFSRVFRIPMDKRRKARGNGRIAFTLADGTTVDVMARRPPARQPYPDLTLKREAAIGPDVVVLVSFDGFDREPQFVGWMADAEIREYGLVQLRDDVENHLVPHEALRPIWELMARHRPDDPLAIPPPVLEPQDEPAAKPAATPPPAAYTLPLF